MIICQICQRELKNNQSLANHITRSHYIKPKDYYDKYLKKDDKRICPECGKETNFINLTIGYYKYCSIKCSSNSKEKQNNMKQTCLKKYGVKNPYQNKEIQDKIKQTNLKKYGVEYISQSKKIKNKKKNTCLDRYGVKYPLQSNKLKDKMKQTCLDRYGVDNPHKCQYIKNKINHTIFIDHYNNKILKFKEVRPLFPVDEYKGTVIINNKNYIYIKYKWQCKICGNIFEDHIHSKLPRCLNCYPLLNGFSKQEKQVVTYIKSIYTDQMIENTREIISPYELDVYLPELKLAIEYNGDYWHSKKYNPNIKQYHKMKTNLCKQQGIRLLHIAEKDWLNKNDYIKDKINEFLNINNNITFKEKSNGL